jgi:hypothetical protein
MSEARTELRNEKEGRKTGKGDREDAEIQRMKFLLKYSVILSSETRKSRSKPRFLSPRTQYISNIGIRLQITVY